MKIVHFLGEVNISVKNVLHTRIITHNFEILHRHEMFYAIASSNVCHFNLH
jgi:hypothetical protein